MAMIKFGALTQDVRGTLSGMVFSRNRGGAYVRGKVSPVQPLSDFNGVSRAIFGAIAQRWSTFLSDAQRAGWDAFAAVHPFINVFGDSIILSGIAMYQSLNRRVLQIGGAYIDDAPSEFNVPDPMGFIVAMTAAAGIVSLCTVTAGRAFTYGEVGYIFGTPQLLGARSVQKNDLRLVNSQVDGDYTNGEDIKADYQTRFDPLAWVAGQRCAIRAMILNQYTGAISSPQLVNVVLA